MARPPRYNADYYTHDADLRNDRRVKAIRTKFGAAGYGLLHMLLEALTDADHTQLDTADLEIELLAGDFGVSATEIHNLIQFAESIGYFSRNEAGLLVCAELNKWLEPVFEKRNRTRNTAAGELLPQAVSETRVSVTGTTQSKVNKSKEKESKKGMDGGQPASQPVFASQVEEKKEGQPASVKLWPDEAEVFTISGFAAFVNKMSFGHIDKGMYLPDIQRRADLMQQQRDETGWENFIHEFLKREVRDRKLVTLEQPAASGESPRPSYGPAPTITKQPGDSYNLKKLAISNLIPTD